MQQNPELMKLAVANLQALGNNPYPGRGIVIGMNESGTHVFQIYWIMGRSQKSRTRIFKTNEFAPNDLDTVSIDPHATADPGLTIYKAMTKMGNSYVVSNGAQTVKAGVFGLLDNRFTAIWQYEPDTPNFTPRITAVVTLSQERSPLLEMSLLKKSPFSDECDIEYYRYKSMHPGVGYCITTYEGDGDPLPSFNRTPYLLPLSGSADDIADNLWHVLNKDNKISLAVKSINIKTQAVEIQVINKYKEVL